MHIQAATGLGASAYNLEMVEMGIQLDNMVCTHKYHELRPKLWALGQLQEEGMDISLLEVFFFCSLGDGSSERMFDKGDFTIDSC